MSQALRETISLNNLMKEINEVFPLYIPEPKFVLKVHEDNQSCIAMSKNPKFTNRTKHVAIKYHHFRKYMKDGLVSILPIDTKERIVDIFTKPLSEIPLTYLRKKMQGW